MLLICDMCSESYSTTKLKKKIDFCRAGHKLKVFNAYPT